MITTGCYSGRRDTADKAAGNIGYSHIGEGAECACSDADISCGKSIGSSSQIITASPSAGAVGIDLARSSRVERVIVEQVGQAHGLCCTAFFHQFAILQIICAAYALRDG